MFFFWNDAKNIDIWILRKAQNLFRSEFYMSIPSLVKIDWEMPVKNPRWPPLNLVFCHFNIRPRWFPAHHRDRLVLIFFHSLLLVLFFYHTSLIFDTSPLISFSASRRNQTWRLVAYDWSKPIFLSNWVSTTAILF